MTDVVTGKNITVVKRYRDMGLGQDGKQSFAEEVFIANKNLEYETVAASQTAQALGATGVVGDYLERLIVVVATAATAQVQIKDGSDTAITIFPNNPGGGVGTYVLPVGLRSRTGAWAVTTGAGASVLAVGDFT